MIVRTGNLLKEITPANIFYILAWRTTDDNCGIMICAADKMWY